MPITALAKSKTGHEPSGHQRADSATQVYALGELGFDFGTREQRDAIVAANGGQPVLTLADLGKLLGSFRNGADFYTIVWTLVVDGEPMYAFRPAHGLHVFEFFAVTMQMLMEKPLLDRIVVPGRIRGEAKLLDGRVVPLIDPDVRGLHWWSSDQIAAAVKLAGVAALPPATVDLASEGSIDWITWSAPKTCKAPPSNDVALEVIGAGGAGVLSTYSSTVRATWTNGAPTASGGTNAGVCVSGAGCGLRLRLRVVPGQRTLRLYARSFASAVQLTARFSSEKGRSYLDSSFNAFAAIAGLPGVVDGVYTLVYDSPVAQELVIELVAAVSTDMRPSPLTVTLYAESAGAGRTQTLGVGVWPGSAVTIPTVASTHVPQGLRLTLLNATGPGAVLTANTSGTNTDVRSEFARPTDSLIVEPEHYVGVQALTIGACPLPLLSTDTVADFMDRVYYLVRNRGVSSQERAINYAALQATSNNVFADALASGLALEGIVAEPMPLAPPGADCWDVKFLFFAPMQATQAGRLVARMTVDVAGVRPITIGPPRAWRQH